jgi:hypothetical protein
VAKRAKLTLIEEEAGEEDGAREEDDAEEGEDEEEALATIRTFIYSPIQWDENDAEWEWQEAETAAQAFTKRPAIAHLGLDSEPIVDHITAVQTTGLAEKLLSLRIAIVLFLGFPLNLVKK